MSITPNPRNPDPIVNPAFALSGGASHGDFEVGVTRYLYDQKKFRPRIICGTSVGSIAALKLAEGEPAEPAKPAANGHLQGLAGLEKIWNSLELDSDMFEPQPDLFAKFKDDAMSILKDAAGQFGLSVLLGPLGFAIPTDTPDAIGRLVADIKTMGGIRSLYNLDPTEKLLAKPESLDEAMVRGSGIQVRLAMVALDDGQLRYVTEKGAVLERDGAVTLGAPVFDPKIAGPILHEMAQTRAEILDAEKTLADTQSPGSASTLVKLMTRLSELMVQLVGVPRVQNPLTVDLRRAAVASSSIPVVFPPVEIGSQWYVDGGVRTITPIRAALDMGADFVYAVVAGAEHMSAGTDLITQMSIKSFDPPADLLDIAGRAGMDIMPDQIGIDDLNPPNGFGKPVVIIQPEVDVHDSMTIDPGLIRIRVAHGFMRADDTVKAYEQGPANYQKLTAHYAAIRGTTVIVKLRRKIWQGEFAANGWKYLTSSKGSPTAPTQTAVDPQALENVRHWKRELKDLVDQRAAAGGMVPGGIDQWWLQWEAHSWKPVQALWDAQNPFVPLKTMHVTVAPPVLQVNKPVQFTVHADDGGKPITDAAIFVDGAKIGVTGQALEQTFLAKTVIEFDLETKHKWTEVIAPVCAVTKTGYFPASPFQFEEGSKAVGQA